MTTLISRRKILTKAAVLPMAAAAACRMLSNTSAAALQPIVRSGGSWLKTSLNAYSFLELLNANAKDSSKGMDLFAVCDFCAKHNFDAVDLTGYFFPGYPKPPPDNYLFKLKRHAFDRGLAISGTGVRNDFTAADPAVRQEGVDRIKAWIETAARLGAPVIRAFADSQPPFKNWQQASGNAPRHEVEAWMADDLRSCAEHGKKFGVIVGVQNHGDFINSADDHLSLLNRVDHEWCAALVDTGKYLRGDPYGEIRKVAPFAVNWQIKETMGSSTASPEVDMLKLVTLIRESGFRGYLPIETLAMGRAGYDSRVAIPKMLEELRASLKATESVLPGTR